MRDYSYTKDNERVVGAKAVFTNTLPIFSSDTITDTSISGYTSYDADVYSSGILRVAVVGGVLAYQYITDIDSIPAWTVTAEAVAANTSIGVYSNRIFFRNNTDDVVYCDFTIGSGLGTVTKIGDIAGTIKFAPVSTTLTYYCVLVSDYIKKIGYIDTASSTDEWDGRIYGTTVTVSQFDAERVGAIDYILVGEDEDKRTLFLSRNNTVWSDTRYVFPLDVLDDTSYYEFASCSIINSKFVAAIKIRRNNGPIMLTYAFGPERYTSGREMFIDEVLNSFTADGKLHQIGTEIVYIGPDVLYRSDATVVFGYSNPSKTFNTTALSKLRITNSPTGMVCGGVAVPGDLAVATGQDIEIYQVIDSTEYLIGTFDIDAKADEQLPDGEMRELTGRAKGTKRLAQWASDTSYDYWSQTKQSSDPDERGELIRVTGQYNWEETDITPTKLNVDGYIQVVAKACRDGMTRAKFNRVTGTYQGYYGVGLQFYRLSIYEIAEILDKEIEDVTEEEANSTGANGIMALYGTDLGATGAGISLFKVRNGEMTALTSADYTVPLDEDHWLMIYSHDGEITVKFGDIGVDDSIAWLDVLTYTYEDDDGVWFSGDLFDKIGRGFYFMKNVTPNQECYAFKADANLIPLKGSHSVFPSSGQVLVDDERINYSAKSSNATHYGPYEFGGLSLIVENDTTSGSTQNFSDLRSRNAIRQSINEGDFYVRSIEVYVSDVGTTDDGLKVCVYTGPVAQETPVGRLVSSQTIGEEDITGTFGWVTAYFPLRTKMENGDWVIMYREQNPTQPDSTKYFRTKINNGYGSGAAATFNEDTDQWMNLNGDFPFKIYGVPLSRGNSYGVEIVGGPNLSSDALDDCVLVVTDGQGKYANFTITSYTYGTPNSTVYVSEDPSEIMDTTSYVCIAPSLIVSRRGAAGTAKTYHGETICSIYSTPQLSMKKGEYFSNDIDMTIGEMVTELCAKANVDCTPRQRSTSGSQSIPEDFTLKEAGRYGIAKMTGDFSADEAGMYFGDATNCVMCALFDTEVSIYYYNGSSWELREWVDTGIAMNGEARFSFYEGTISVWMNNRHLFSYTIIDTITNNYLGFYSFDAPTTMTINWEETDVRMDNFILDMGERGDRLLGSLIGEKRIYFKDNADGTIEVFTSHDSLGSLDLGHRFGEIHTNAAVATRIRVEGGDVKEVIDSDIIKKHGNVFRLLNSRESFDMYDTERFAEQAIDDLKKTYYAMLQGFADPRIEPQDEITLPDTTVATVETIDITGAVDEQSVIFDMSLRIKWLES